MSYRTLLISAVLAAGASLAGLAQADIVAGENGGIAVKESDGLAPSRGMTMSQVASKFGAPVTKVPAVGTPPISRWEYPGFVVYFERDHVIHSVISEAGAPASGSGSAEATAAPAAPSPPEAPAAENSAPPAAEPATAAASPPPAAPAPPAASAPAAEPEPPAP